MPEYIYVVDVAGSLRESCTEQVAVVEKQPEYGKVKTWLCPPLTPEQAADLYEAFFTVKRIQRIFAPQTVFS